MKPFLVAYLLIFANRLIAQNPPATDNVFIITTDGFRWQEVFRGADSVLIRDPRVVKDTSLMLQQFWDDNLEARRSKLMPFFWSVIATRGQLAGNRDFENKVNVANFYKISYPGYSEIFTGYPDKVLIPNLPICNHNINILAYLNTLPSFKGRVAAFCSWSILPKILNEKEVNFPINGGYDLLDEEDDSVNVLINQVQNNIESKGPTRHDLLTFESAKNYIEKRHPRVLFLGLGETDECAHKYSYDGYLQKAHQIDEMIAELWYYVQTDPYYKGHTSFIITTDHGRGSQTYNWNSHGFWVKHSGETWLAMIGEGIAPAGELRGKQQVYQKQIAASMAMLLGEQFFSNHQVGAPLFPISKSNRPPNYTLALSVTAK